MNAKFEKWFDGTFSHRELPVANDEYLAARSAWQAAIQSLEVTDELVSAAKDAIYGSSDYQPAYGGYIGHEAIEEAVRAVISALKEQAK